MQLKSKQRLLGGILIFAALLLVLLPMLLHRSHPVFKDQLTLDTPGSPNQPKVVMQLQLPQQEVQTAASSPSVDQQPAVVMGVAPSQQAAESAALPQQPKQVAEDTSSSQPANHQKADAITLSKESHSDEGPEIATNTPSDSKKVSTTAEVEKPNIQAAAAQKVKKAALASQKTNQAGADADKLKVNSVLPEAWSIQLAVFRDKDNATRLVKKLRGKGYDAYVQERSNSSGSLSQVYVGPMINHQKAIHIGQRLDQEFHVKSIIKRYQA